MTAEQFHAQHAAGLMASWGEPRPDLERFLTLQPPDQHRPVDDRALASVPPILSFERRREVDLAWGDVLSPAAEDLRLSVVALRSMVETSWQVPADGMDAETLLGLRSGDRPRIRAAVPEPEAEPAEGEAEPAEGEADAMVPVELVRAAIDEAGAPTEQPLEPGVVFLHGSGRYYLVVSARPLGVEDFSTPERYEQAWADDIDGLEQVFVAGKVAEQITEFTEIDLRPMVIERVMSELLERRKIADLVAAEVERRAAETTKGLATALLEGTETDTIEDRLIAAKLAVFDLERRIDRVVAQASGLGYVVFKEDAELTIGPNETLPVVAGDVYQSFRRQAVWTTTHVHTEHYNERVALIFRRRRSRQVRTQRQHSKQVTDYRKVDTSRDPLVAGVEELRLAGFEVYVFARSASGFVTSEGVTLASVMTRCELDESVRQRTAVVLPVFEDRLAGRRSIVKYSVFKRPVRGRLAVDLPRISMVEQLAYRTAWKGTEVGELVSGINLAPGESRTVVVSKEYSRETNVGRSATSAFEVNETRSSDLATEMENQFSTESEEASYLDTEASVSGSYGLVSAEASAKAGTSASMKQASQAISRVARKSAESINRQNREEVTTTSSTRTLVTTADRTTAVLENINDGRTLNLMFYRVYNRYDSGLFLDDLKVEIVSGVETIAGSGVREAVTLPLHSVEDLMPHLDVDQLPYEVDRADEFRYRTAVIEAIIETIEKEYAKPGSRGRRRLPPASAGVARGGAVAGTGGGAAPDDDGDDDDDVGTASGVSVSVELVALAPSSPLNGGLAESIGADPTASAAVMAGRDRASVAEHEYEQALAAATARLEAVAVAADSPRDTQQLRIASGALYLDAALGVVPATEPFSEAMRRQEVRFRAAEALRIESEAGYLRGAQD